MSFSKLIFNRRLLGFVTAITMLATGCDFGSNLKIGERDERNDQVNYNTTNFQCMWDLGKKIGSYFDGELSDRQISDFMECVRGALRRFAYVTSPRSGYYDPQALAQFLNEKFLRPNEHLNENIVSEIMALKAVILGGDEVRLTTTEFNELIDLITVIEELAIKSREHVAVYAITEENADRFTAEQVEAAKAALAAAGRDLAREFGRSGNSYQYGSMRRLLEESDALYKWRGEGPESWSPADLVDLFSAIKGIATSGPDDRILAEEWEPMVNTLTGIHGIYMDMQKHVRSQEHILINNMNAIVNMVDSGLKLLEDAVAVSPSHFIPYARFDQLVDVLDRRNMLKVSMGDAPALAIRPSTIKDIYRHLIGVALRDPNIVERRSIDPGLDLEALGEARSEFMLWVDAQNYLTDTAEWWAEPYHSPGRDIVDQIWSLIQHFDFTEYLNAPAGSRRVRSDEMEFIAKYIRPFFAVNDSRVYVVPKTELEPLGIRHNWQNLTRMNVIRVFVRLLIRSFADRERVLTMQGVTIDELEEFYNTVKPLGVDLRYMDPGKTGVGARTFNEANLFTFNGDGVPAADANPLVVDRQEIMTYTETIELLALLWSAGQVRDRMYYRLVEECTRRHGPGQVDRLGDPKIPRECFYYEFARNQLVDMQNLPLMQNYLLSRTSDQRNKVLSDLEAVSAVCNDNDWIENGEIATMTTVLHYVEVIFSIYDMDRNGILNEQEVMRAFGRFHGYLSTAVERMQGRAESVSFLKAIYVYLLNEKRLPTAVDAPLLYFYSYRFFDDNPFQYGRVNGDAPMSYAFDLERPEIELPARPPSAPTIQLDRGGLVEVLKVLAETSTTSMDCR